MSEIKYLGHANVSVWRIGDEVAIEADAVVEDADSSWLPRLKAVIAEAKEDLENWVEFDEAVKAGRKPAPWSEEDTTFVPRGTYYVAGEFDWWDGFRRHMRDWLGV